MATAKLTKTTVEAMTPQAKDVYLWDTVLPRFGVRVTPDRAGPGGDVHLHGGRGIISLSLVGECRYGSRKDAGCRHSAAPDECGRFEHFIDVFDVGTGE